MKKLYTAAVLCMLVYLEGCIKQDYSLCGVENNLVLSFKYEDAAGKDIFSDKINSVDVTIFDENYFYTAHKRVSQSDLNNFRGVRFSLDPGTYYAVCWGNVSSYSLLPYLDNSSVLSNCQLITVSDESGSQLYYSPAKEVGDTAVPSADYTIYRIVVPGGTVTEKTMEFVRAHRSVHVYVKNFKYAEMPVIELTNMPQSYNFLLETLASRKNYQRVSGLVNTPDGEMYLASFHTPIAKFAPDMDVKVRKNPDLTVVGTLNLKDWVDSNIHTIEDINEISLIVEFGLDGSVAISIPNWSNEDVDPDWGND